MATTKRAPATPKAKTNGSETVENGQNGHANGEGAITANQLAVLAAISSRATIAGRLGKSYGNQRDLYTALGYNRDPQFGDYLARYRRQDIAKAVIDAPVRSCWRSAPAIAEVGFEGASDFDKAWQLLAERRRLYHYFSRVDRLAAIGEYAVLLIGFDDGAALDQPAGKATDVLYVMPYSQANAQIAAEVEDSRDERYGQPEFYTINFRGKLNGQTTGQRVHWTRVLHVAEDTLESDSLGQPRLEAIFNRLEDLERVAGGGAEMFWRGAFPGYGFQLAKDATVGAQTLDQMQTEIEEYMHGLKRYLKLQGVDIKDMAMQVADPSNHFQMLVDLISAATRIPKRILLGSERGELASSQDQRNWAQRIDERRREHCEPTILRPFIDRLVTVGVLQQPKEGYSVKWPDLLLLTKKERAQVGEVMSRAVKNFMLSGEGARMIPPRLFLEIFLGLDQTEIERAVGLLPALEKAVPAADENAPAGSGTVPPAPMPQESVE